MSASARISCLTPTWRSAPTCAAAVALALGLPCLAADPEVTSYQHYHKEKRFTVDISDGHGGVIAGPDSGEFRYIVHAFAQDKELKDHFDTPQSGDPLRGIPLAVDLAHGGTIKNDTPVREDHSWSDWIGFDQAQNAIAQRFPGQATSAHASSEATVDLVYTPPVPTSTLGHGVIVLDGTARTTAIPQAHQPETAFAEAASGGEFHFTGEIKSLDIRDGKFNTQIEVNDGRSSVSSVKGISDQGPVNFDPCQILDPLSLSFVDKVTGRVIARQDLFSENWSAKGKATVDYDPATGLRLAAAAGGSASLSFATLSDWVLNGFNGTASIVDGVFTATGDLASLDWVVQLIDGELQATLAANQFDLDFDFEILATGLGTPANDLLLTYSDDAVAVASAYATIAEPSSLVLVAAAGLSCLAFGRCSRRRRRVEETCSACDGCPSRSSLR